jgi:PAS domain S-box-containing protein
LRKLAKRAFKQAPAYAKSIVETMRDPLVVLDGDLRVVSANHSFYQSFKVKREETEGQLIYELGNRQWDIPVLRDLLQEIIPRKTTFEDMEVLHDFPDIGRRTMLLNARRLDIATNETQMILLVIEDITERKQAEDALKKSSEKIKLFAYSVSHDLKSPAIGIYGLTKLLHKHYKYILDKKGKRYCDQILKASEQIAALVEQINVYISTKELPLAIESIKLKEILRMVREEFSAQLNIRQIRWLEPDWIHEISADRLSIMRVLRNLVDNALKYGGDDLSEINIGYKESDECHILSVKDDGIGIKAEDSEEIFGLFIREKTSKGTEGSGLGLAIVREIAEKHGGNVWVQPGQGKGITFYISIPGNLKPSRQDFPS